MATYIILAKFTDQGARNIKDSPKREDAFRKLCEKLGAKVKDAYRTMGRYDVAAIVDAPDDVTMNAILYSLGALGNVRTETLRAFTRQETLGGHLKTGQSWTGQNRPVGRAPQAQGFYSIGAIERQERRGRER